MSHTPAGHAGMDLQDSNVNSNPPIPSSTWQLRTSPRYAPISTPPRRSAAGGRKIELHATQSDLKALPVIPMEVLLVDGFTRASCAPAGMDVDLSGGGSPITLIEQLPRQGDCSAGTAAVAMQGPKLILDSVARGIIEGLEARVTKALKLIERWVQELLAIVLRGPLLAVGMAENEAFMSEFLGAERPLADGEA